MTTPTTPTSRQSIEQHPDIVDLRARYDQSAANPRVQGAEALAVIVGLYLAVSPWVAGFRGSTGLAIFTGISFTNLAVNNLITGIAYALLMAGFGHAYERTHTRAWAAALIGLWTIITPWAVAGNVHTTRTITSQCITGAVALLLALAVAGMSATKRRAASRSRYMGN